MYTHFYTQQSQISPHTLVIAVILYAADVCILKCKLNNMVLLCGLNVGHWHLSSDPE